jgi:predicted secreted protein
MNFRQSRKGAPVSITAAFVLFAVIWFMVLFVVLPLSLVTQGEAGEIVPGTPAGAPHVLNLRRKFRLTTLWAIGIFAVVASVIVWGPWTVEDIDWFDRMDLGAPPG